MGQNAPASAGDAVSIARWERCCGEGHGNPLQCSCLENPMGRGAWQATVHGVAKSWTWLSDWTMKKNTHYKEDIKKTKRSKLQNKVNWWENFVIATKTNTCSIHEIPTRNSGWVTAVPALSFPHMLAIVQFTLSLSVHASL